MTFTSTEENYIKSIYHLQTSKGEVTTTRLSQVMNTRPATVTDMLKKLRSKKILHYQRYKGFSLTDSGMKTALSIVRKHRLWEYFLVNKLGFEWDKVHDVAEELEHVNSEELITRLDEYLGYPDFDPHGDPIPDHKGRVKKIKQMPLTRLPVNQLSSVSAVGNQSTEMLELLNHYRISIGSKIRVSKRFDFDGSVEIKVEKQGPFLVSEQVAQNIYCSL